LIFLRPKGRIIKRVVISRIANAGTRNGLSPSIGAAAERRGRKLFAAKEVKVANEGKSQGI
jgi:hypothetical protein